MPKKDRDLTKKSGGNKKKGRNRVKCAKYRLYNMRERNRDRRAARILKGFRIDGRSEPVTRRGAVVEPGPRDRE